MDLGSLFLVLALVILVSLFISRPLFDRKTESAPLVGLATDLRSDHERSSLLAEQERLLTALQELDFDQVLGKIPAEDYPMQRAALLREGVAVLRKLDELQPSPVEKSAMDQAAEDRIEEVIAARRADAVARATENVSPGTDEKLENLIASRRRGRQEKSAGFCPKCGRPLQKSDLFCSRCGAKIK